MPPEGHCLACFSKSSWILASVAVSGLHILNGGGLNLMERQPSDLMSAVKLWIRNSFASTGAIRVYTGGKHTHTQPLSRFIELAILFEGNNCTFFCMCYLAGAGRLTGTNCQSIKDLVWVQFWVHWDDCVSCILSLTKLYTQRGKFGGRDVIVYS